jgi:hypothetical protein
MAGGRRHWEFRFCIGTTGGFPGRQLGGQRNGGGLTNLASASVVALPRMRTETASGRVARTAGTWRLRAVHRSSFSSAFASFRSGVWKPSVNQP